MILTKRMKKIILKIVFLIFLIIPLEVNGASKNKDTYEYLDLFGQIFDRVRSEYVDEVTVTLYSERGGKINDLNDKNQKILSKYFLSVMI